MHLEVKNTPEFLSCYRHDEVVKIFKSTQGIYWLKKFSVLALSSYRQLFITRNLNLEIFLKAFLKTLELFYLTVVDYCLGNIFWS